jgi:hypothetical protein
MEGSVNDNGVSGTLDQVWSVVVQVRGAGRTL